ncbi:TIGR03619 family F420-dependent LLM class oxidoreductase [Amycolatopsis pigmentata]|uniref:TIGR03619 family F420-dependent LLM class oxidoreductase n=1 Tax=Amycolatopsis pigmentata TaxID=450801 RepID=A0ABW5G815_9PSEU
MSGVHASPANIKTIAQAAERLGYDSLWTYERLLRPMAPLLPGPDGNLERIPDIYQTTFEPLETLSYVASFTSRITLGTNIVIPLFHAPVVLARRYATLDQFSGGRAVAGFGQGWMPQEYATAGVPMKRRGAGFDDVIAAIRACWGADPVEYAGRFYSIEASEVNPKPVRGDIPIVVGANSDAGIDRAARIADGITPLSFGLDMVTAQAERFRTAAERHGRNPAALTVTAQTNHAMQPKPISGDRPFLAGAPKQLADDIEQLRDRGFDGVLFAGLPTDEISAQIEMLDELRSLVPAG